MYGPQPVRPGLGEVGAVRLPVPAELLEVRLGVKLHPDGIIQEATVLLLEEEADGVRVDLLGAIEDLVDLAVETRLLLEVVHVHDHGVGVERGAVLESHPLAEGELVGRRVDLLVGGGHVEFPPPFIVGRLEQRPVHRMRGVEVRQAGEEDLDVRALDQGPGGPTLRVVLAQDAWLDVVAPGRPIWR